MILDQIDRGNFLRILCYFEIFWPLCCILMMRVILLSSHSTLLEWKKVSWWIKKIFVRVHKQNSDSFVNPELYFKLPWGPWTTSTFWQRENNQEIAINILLYNKLIVISFCLAFMILKKNIVFKGPTHFFVCTLYSQTWL